MKYLATLFIALFCISVSAQKSTVRAIKINRIEIKDGGYYTNGEPSSEIIRLLSLNKRKYKGGYDYWQFSNVCISTTTNISGSLTSIFKSTSIDVSVTNNNQELILEFVNNSNWWIGLDLSSVNFFISYFVNDKKIEYPTEDFSKTMGTLFNYERGEYDYVLLPPHAKTISALFRIDGGINGYDIIHDCIKDCSRLDFEVPFVVYETNPFDPIKSRLINKQTFQYTQYTPIRARLNYKGGYYKEGEAIHIHNDYVDLVKTMCSFVHGGALKFVCDIDIQLKSLPLHKNKFGLYVFDK